MRISTYRPNTGYPSPQPQFGRVSPWVIGGVLGVGAIAHQVAGLRGNRDQVIVNRGLAASSLLGRRLPELTLHQDAVYPKYSPEQRVNITEHALRYLQGREFTTIKSQVEGFDIYLGYVPPQQGRPVVLYRPGADQRVDDARPLLRGLAASGYGLLTYIDPLQNQAGESLSPKQVWPWDSELAAGYENFYKDNLKRASAWLENVKGIPTGQQIWGGTSLGGYSVLAAAAEAIQSEKTTFPARIFTISIPASQAAFAEGWSQHESDWWYRLPMQKTFGPRIRHAIEALSNAFNIEAPLKAVSATIPTLMLRGREDYSGTAEAFALVEGPRFTQVSTLEIPKTKHTTVLNDALTRGPTGPEALSPKRHSVSPALVHLKAWLDSEPDR